MPTLHEFSQNSRPNNDKPVQKQTTKKHPYSNPSAARQKLEDWFNSHLKVTVTELNKKIGTHVEMLLFELNKGKGFKYTEHSIVDHDRFLFCISFLAARFYLRQQKEFFKPPKKKQIKKKAKKKPEVKAEKTKKKKDFPRKKQPITKVEGTKKKVPLLAEPDMEPEIRWRRVRLIGHPKQ